MSKQSTSRLTASRKNRRQPAPPTVDCLDGLFDRLETIGTLAGLLEAAGGNPQVELVKPELVSRAGVMILAEVEKAREWLDQLEEEAAR
jgi:hypothetical protein